MDQNNINFENVTLEDCIEMYEMRNYTSVVENGMVVVFERE